MTDSQFNNMVAQLSHFSWAMLVLTWAALLCPHHFYLIWVIGECLAAVKEFIFDPTCEDPTESGGFWGDVMDFGFYTLGALAGWGAVLAKGLL